ncbi:MAG: hypothetical protein JXR20_08230 [Balneola sp.]
MKRLVVLLIGLVMSSTVIAQNGESPISYKSLAIQMSNQNSNGDSFSSSATSVSSFNGFGSFIDNPAAMALAKGSFYSIGWLNQSNNQESNYLGVLNSSEFSNLSFGNLGLVYKVPTNRGSLVVGGGYSLVSKDNDEIFIDAFNSSNSITDLFKQSNSDYNDIAFDAYAIDFRNSTSNDIESIFRVDSRPSGFRGINQFANISNRKTVGEISLFAATEVQKNLFIGGSIGFLTGSIKYDRNFEELDENNLYADGAIPADGTNPATDIYSITLTDDLDTDFYAFSARGGVVYKALPILKIGASFVLPSRMIVTENYYSNIDTELDDFTSFKDNNYSGEFDYAVTKPGEFKLGATIDNIGGLSISATVEYIDYSSTEVDLTLNSVTNDLTPSEIAFLSDDEELTNEAIARDYAAVTNFRSHISYTLENGVILLGGYSFYPNPRGGIGYNHDRSVYSVGLSVPITNAISANISGQYLSRDDRSLVYEFVSNSNQLIQNTVRSEIERLNILAGVKFKF